MNNVSNVINNEILMQCNWLEDKLFNMVSYDLYEVCDNLYHEEEDEYGELEPKDIYQWYFVTEWLYKRLNAIGEPTVYIDELDVYVWGRTCCGQLIEADGTIQEAINHV